MPIREYTNKTEGLQLSDRSSDAAIRAGREISANYGVAAAYTNRLGESLGSAVEATGKSAVKYMEADEINKGAPAFMGVYAERQKAWEDELKAKPDDPTLQGRYLAQTEEQLQKFRESFTTEGGQKWAESRIDAFRQHLVTKTTADISNVAASQIKVKVDQTKNAASAMAANDPASLPFLLENFNASIDGLVGSNTRLTATQAAQVAGALKQEGAEKIVQAAIKSRIMNDPEAGLRMAKDKEYSKYVDGNDVNMLANWARKSKADEARLRKLEQKQQQSEAIEKTAVDLVRATVVTDPETGISTRQLPSNYYQQVADKLGTLPGIRDEQLRALMSYGHAVENDHETPAAISNKNYVEILGKIRSGEMDAEGIYDARIKNKINRGDFNQAVNDLQNFRSPTGQRLEKSSAEFFTKYSSVIDVGMKQGIPSALGSMKIYDAMADARRAAETLRKEGKDPNLVYQPGKDNPYFFGRPENIAKYQVSLAEADKYSRDLDKKFQEQQKAAAEAAKNNPAAPLPPIVTERIPPGATRRVDGNYYVVIDGKTYRVDENKQLPQVPRQ